MTVPVPQWHVPITIYSQFANRSWTGMARSANLDDIFREFNRVDQKDIDHLTEIGYGHTASYAAVARLAGNPKAVRAAATACATNPLPVIVPCHRVIYSDGRIGRYLGGPDAKRTLLTLESAG